VRVGSMVQQSIQCLQIIATAVGAVR
jgi:hypothetical protein